MLVSDFQTTSMIVLLPRNHLKRSFPFFENIYPARNRNSCVVLDIYIYIYEMKKGFRDINFHIISSNSANFDAAML